MRSFCQLGNENDSDYSKRKKNRHKLQKKNVVWMGISASAKWFLLLFHFLLLLFCFSFFLFSFVAFTFGAMRRNGWCHCCLSVVGLFGCQAGEADTHICSHDMWPIFPMHALANIHTTTWNWLQDVQQQRTKIIKPKANTHGWPFAAYLYII